MKGRLCRDLKLPLKQEERGERFDLMPYVDNGRVTVSGEFKGKLALQWCIDGGRDEASWITFAVVTGKGSFSMDTFELPPDIMFLSVVCLEEISHGDRWPVKVTFTGVAA